MAACGFDLVEHGVGWAERVTARAQGCRAPPEILEGLRPIGGRRGSAGAQESARLAPGLVGGVREVEDVRSAGRPADAPAVGARTATIWGRSPATRIRGGSVRFWGTCRRPHLLASNVGAPDADGLFPLPVAGTGSSLPEPRPLVPPSAPPGRSWSLPKIYRRRVFIGVPKERHQRCAHGAAWTEAFGWREECLRCVEQVRCRSTHGRKQSRADRTGFPPHDVLGGVRHREKTEAPSGRSGLPDASTRGERHDGVCRLSFAYGAGGRAVPVPPPVPGVFGVPPGLGPTGLVAGAVGLCT